MPKIAKNKAKSNSNMSIKKEFKEFIMKGNVMDLAIGVVIGAAFGKIVSSLVENILMPFLGILMQGINFQSFSVKVGEAEIKYGMFIGAIIDFLIIAAVLFLVIKGINKINKTKVEAPPAEAPSVSREEALLAEIRDLLKNK